MTDNAVFLANGEVYRKVTNSVGVAQIRKIDKEHYVLLKTGEVLPFEHKSKRVEDFGYLKHSFSQIEYLIKNNFNQPENCLWVTMTYRFVNGKPMTDPKRLYLDFHQFLKGLNRYLLNAKLGKPKWLYVVEPQRSGAWHIHMILDIGQPSKVNHPLIPNKLIETLWKRGFTKVKTLQSKDNISAYLSAYLTNDGKHSKKGSRLHFYPKGMRIYRTSRNLVKPFETNDSEIIQKKVGSMGNPTSVTASEILGYARGAFFRIFTEQSKYKPTLCNVQCAVHKHFYISDEAQKQIGLYANKNCLPSIVINFLSESILAKQDEGD